MVRTVAGNTTDEIPDNGAAGSGRGMTVLRNGIGVLRTFSVDDA